MNLKTLLFPPLCFGCEEEGSYFCKECRKDILVNNSPTTQYTQEGYLDEVIIGFSYTESIKKCVSSIKYIGVTSCIPQLIEKLSYVYSFGDFDVSQTLITSVPLHRYKHYFVRGYNQSELLAKQLSTQIGLSYQRVFKKKRWTRSQTKLSRIKRKINVYGTFELLDDLPEGITTVLIVDDIITTGATCKSLGKILKKHYPGITVIGVFIARN